jgi:predicted MFS family arabinose efflux permease
VAVGVVVIATLGWLLLLPSGSGRETAGDQDTRDVDTARGGRLAPGVLLLGLLVFCCLVGEGAAADWSTVYLRDSLGAGDDIATAGYAMFSIMMVAGRLAGDRLTAKLGRVLEVGVLQQEHPGAMRCTGSAARPLMRLVRHRLWQCRRTSAIA